VAIVYNKNYYNKISLIISRLIFGPCDGYLIKLNIY